MSFFLIAVHIQLFSVSSFPNILIANTYVVVDCDLWNRWGPKRHAWQVHCWNLRKFDFRTAHIFRVKWPLVFIVHSTFLLVAATYPQKLMLLLSSAKIEALANELSMHFVTILWGSDWHSYFLLYLGLTSLINNQCNLSFLSLSSFFSVAYVHVIVCYKLYTGISKYESTYFMTTDPNTFVIEVFIKIKETYISQSIIGSGTKEYRLPL